MLQTIFRSTSLRGSLLMCAILASCSPKQETVACRVLTAEEAAEATLITKNDTATQALGGANAFCSVVALPPVSAPAAH